MEDKLFCRKCHCRIWRNFDAMPYNDTYLEDQHMNCAHSLAADKSLTNPQTGINPYLEHEPSNE